MVLIAPIIEELFVRDFLNRIIVSKNFKKVPIGKFTVSSFVFTVLFFGFSHSMWLAGIVTGIAFNLYLMKVKKIESLIVVHSVTNLILFFYVMNTQKHFLW